MSKPASAPPALVAYLQACPKDDPSFPQNGIDYYRRFDHLDRYLTQHVHPFVNQGAAVRDNGWLTDHGEDHIRTVLHRASDLTTRDSTTIISPYEAFLLAVAIHFHDVGNVFGREQHERKIAEVMAKLDPTLLGEDGMERRMIRDIAMAHGGYADVERNDKDTIGRLRWRTPVEHREPRIQLLAALLRFADELADDHTRTSRFLLDSQLTAQSEVYHYYADRLRRVSVRPDDARVQLIFELDAKHATRKYQKGPKQRVYLYDEIVARCLKMHREQIYCNRFMQPHVVIDRIDVAITITTAAYMRVLKEITFSLRQRGYPDAPSSLRDVAPDAEQLTGSQLRRIIRDEVRRK